MGITSEEHKNLSRWDMWSSSFPTEGISFVELSAVTSFILCFATDTDTPKERLQRKVTCC